MTKRWRSIVSLLLACALVFGLVPGAGAVGGGGKPPAPKKAVATTKAAALDRATSDAKSAPVRVDRNIPDDAEYMPGEVIVRFKKGASASAVGAANSRAGAASSKRLGTLVPGLRKAELKAGVSVEAAIAAYEKQPDVLYAEPNYIYRAEAVPNDPKFSKLWGMNNTGQTGGTADADIDAPEAWNVTTGSSNVVIAVIDTGIDYNHPDLAANVWTNPGEIAGNGIDDDGNGYVDDIHGWDSANDDGDPMDDNAHGTHCAGTIAGVGNNATGVAGVNWNAKVMGVKFLDASGSGTGEDALEAFEYVASNPNVKVVSNSWGRSGGYSQPEKDAIAAINKLFVFASGNANTNTDSIPHYPSAYDLPNILSVNASDHKDTRAVFSNYGATTTDVFAPGVGIWSTIPANAVFAPTGGSTVFTDDMSDLVGWTQATEPGFNSNPWTTSGAAYVSPPASAANLGYIDNQWSYITPTDALNLASIHDPLYLNLKVRYELEEGTGNPGDTGDSFMVWTFTSNDGWRQRRWWTGTSNGSFEDVWIDVSDVAGQSDVRFTFDLTSDAAGSSAAGYDGVWIDDIKLVTPGSTSLATTDFTSLTGWSTSQYAYNPFAISATRYFSAPSSLAQTNYGGSGEYANNEQAIASKTASVTPGASGIVSMKYKLWQDTEESWDFFSPIYTPGDGYWYFAAEEFSGSTGGWVDRATVPIGGQGQGDVRFGLFFRSDSSVTYEGVYVDDVDIRTPSGSWIAPDYTKAYDRYNGTSMATPHVAGIAGLMLAANPTMGPSSIKSTIMNTVDKKSALSGLCTTGGRVNAAAAVKVAKGTIKGWVKWNGQSIWGASAKVDSMPSVQTASNGVYSVGGVAAGTHKVTFWKTGYVTKTVTGVTTTPGGTTTVNTNLVARPVIFRSPTKSKLVYRRRSGVAKFKLSGTFKTADGKAMRYRRVYLQSSRTGTGGWKNTYALTTNYYGKATKSFKVKTARTRYYRWYMPSSTINTSAYAAKQKVIVK